MQFSKLLGGVLAIPIAIFLILAVSVDKGYSVYIMPFFILVAIVYLMAPQIDWWWAQKHPPKTNPEVVKLLKQYSTYFQKLNGPDKDKFLQRVTYYLMAKEFIPKVGSQVPGPLKVMIVSEAVKMTFGLEDYLMESHERIVTYPHPFPSPTHQKLHHSEVEHEDGVLIFAAAPVINQFKGVGNIFNIVLYEWVAAFKHAKKVQFPIFPLQEWVVFAQKMETPLQLVQASIGLIEYDMSTVAAVLYLSDKERFRKIYPEQSKQFLEIFQQ